MIFELVNDTIEKIEMKRINPILIFFILFAIATARDFIEFSLLQVNYTFLYIIHFNLFYMAIFLAYVFFISVFSKEKIRKVVNIATIGFLLIVIAPIIDYFIFGRVFTYCYHSPDNLLKNILTFFLYEACIGKGIIIETTIFKILAGLYIYYKTKSVLKPIIAFFFFYILESLFALPALLTGLGSNFEVKMSLYYIILNVIFLTLISYRINKKIFFGLIKNSRPLRSLFYVFMVFFGAFLAGIRYADYLFAAMIAIFFIWQFAVVVNDIYDQKIDKLSNKKRPLILKILSEKRYMTVAEIFLLFSLLSGIVAGWIPFLIICLCGVLAVLYSVPPVRIRKNIFATTVIGISSVLAFLVGYFSQLPIFSQEIIYESIILFAAISLGVVAKDFKDYESDKKSGVKTVFTVFGLKRGIAITTVFLFIAFSSPIFLLNTLKDLIIILTLAVVASLYFKKKQDYPMTIVFCILLLFYVMLRLKMLI